MGSIDVPHDHGALFVIFLSAEVTKVDAPEPDRSFQPVRIAKTIAEVPVTKGDLNRAAFRVGGVTGFHVRLGQLRERKWCCSGKVGDYREGGGRRLQKSEEANETICCMVMVT